MRRGLVRGHPDHANDVWAHADESSEGSALPGRALVDEEIDGTLRVRRANLVQKRDELLEATRIQEAQSPDIEDHLGEGPRPHSRHSAGELPAEGRYGESS